LFRRTKSESSSFADTSAEAAAEGSAAAQKKGRPTPSRRDAEAANKVKAKVPRTRKERAAARRVTRTDSTAKMREAMRTGEERYLPARDQGQVRRFVRDYVDHSFSVMELMLPVMVVLLVFGYVGSTALATVSSAALPALLLVVVVDALRLRWKLRRELTRRFPEAAQQGVTMYAVMRSLQVRFLRQPKPQVKIGQHLPERYR
jgi:Flp pilus assembly protein TadB